MGFLNFAFWTFGSGRRPSMTTREVLKFDVLTRKLIRGSVANMDPEKYQTLQSETVSMTLMKYELVRA